MDDHEKANGARVSRLLIDEGTEALRNVFDSIHPPATLAATLNSNRSFLQGLRCINRSQMDVLFPPSGAPSQSKDFDITLLFILLRNICGLHPPASTGSWDANPPATDSSREANLPRIKYYRNKVYGHITSTGVNDANFHFYWKYISAAVVGLGVSEAEVKKLQCSPLEENLYISRMKEWKQKEDRLEVMLNEHQCETSTKLETVSKDQKRILQNQEVMFQAIKEKGKKTHDKDLSDGQRKLDVLEDLAFCDFKSNIDILNKSFHSDTRIWLLKELDCWFKNNDLDSRVMILTAGPGIGKSVLAAKVCKVYEEQGQLAACHFCKFNYSDYRNPHKMMQSLARHMCENVPGFRQKLTEQLQQAHSRETITDAFRVLLMDPLNSMLCEKPLLLVIDGLDESEKGGKSELLDLIANEFKQLPNWIKVFITSRPELPVKKKLQHLNPVEILSDNENNRLDVRCYLHACLSKLHDCDEFDLDDLVDECEGNFLYAYYCQLELNRLQPVKDAFPFVPNSIGSVYEKYFTRLERELKKLSPNIQFDRILEVLVAMKGPLPLSFISDILELPGNTRSMRKVIKEVNESLSALLLVYNDCLTVFHKSVLDWIMCDGYEQHSFSIQEEEHISGHKYLWRACQKSLAGLKRNGLRKEKNKSNEYALENGVKHLWEITHQPRFITHYARPTPTAVDLCAKYPAGMVKIYDDTRKPFGWGCLIAEDSKDLFLMTSNTVLCLLKSLWQCNSSKDGNANIVLRPPLSELALCCAVETEHDFVIISSDENSVLNYAVLRLKLLSEAHFNFSFEFLGVSKRSPRPGDVLSVSHGYSYSLAVGVYKYPKDLLNWLKDGGNVKNPLVKCEPEMNWNSAKDLHDSLIPYDGPSENQEPGSLIFEVNSDESPEVIGLYSCTISFNFDSRILVSFAVRIETIIQDISKKQPDVAKKLFPLYFKAGNV